MTVKNKLARLVKAEQRIADFQRLSQIHERALTEHNAQLEYTWQNGYQTGLREKFKYEPVLDASPRRHEQFVSGELITQKTGWIVQNWRKGWLWLSNWIFILIAWVAYNGIPPELIVFIPEASRSNVIPILSALGVICRFIDQNRNKPLPVIQATQE